MKTNHVSSIARSGEACSDWFVTRKTVVSSALFFIAATVTPAFANKSSVVIDAPASAARGGSVMIKLNVSHKGNNFIHHTDWVFLKVNGKEIKRWEFTMTRLPEAGNFTVEVPLTADGPLEIEAQAHCNIHGSEGAVKASVGIK